MDITIIAPLAPLRSRARLAKIASVFLDEGYRVRYRGWERVKGDADPNSSDPMIEEKAILMGGGKGGKSRLMYPVWLFVVFFWVLLFGRNKKLYCLGWETAFPAVLASVLTRSSIVFDDADRFSLIVKLPRPVSLIIKKLEQWTSRNALLHIVPTFDRYEWKSPNMVELKNSPMRRDYNGAVEIKRDMSESLVVYINGWVGHTRGAPVFLNALNSLSNDVNISVHLAGRVDCEHGEALKSHPKVIYHGSLSQVEALKIYKHCDVVLTYYDPSIEINRLAESNKWGDCIFFGVPFVVNIEVATAKKFVDRGAAFSLPYQDYHALADLLEALYINRGLLSEAGAAARGMINEYPFFDDMLIRLISLKINPAKQNVD